jgi:hypothetical protein
VVGGVVDVETGAGVDVELGAGGSAVAVELAAWVVEPQAATARTKRRGISRRRMRRR